MRTFFRERAEGEEGGIIADIRVPAVGLYVFLTADDQQLAYDLGYTTFEAIYQARESGALDPNDRPEIVFFPDEQYLDRDVDRTGEEGHWRFLTVDDEQIAASQYGGLHGFDDRPTASQIYRLYRLYEDYGLQESSEATRRIEIAWNPGHIQNPGEQGDDPILAPKNKTKLPSPEPHDPTNGCPGGEHDQTSHTDFHMYDSAWHNGRHITVDRAFARLGVEQPHKFHVYTKSGWIKYPHHDEMDWNDTEDVKALNRWRNQAYRRVRIFGYVRTEAREQYTTEERQWLKGIIVKNEGQVGPNTIPQLAKEFNNRFETGAWRSESAIAAIMDRLRKEYHRELQKAEGEEREPEAKTGQKRKADSLFVGSDESNDGEESGEYEGK